MNKKRLLVGVLAGVIILVGIIAIAGLMYSRATRTIADQYIPRTLLVNLSRPLNGSTVHVGDAIPVAAEADGQDSIQSLEFWVDGKLMDRTDTRNPELKQLNGLWEWIPDKEGQFALSVRGLDIRGQSVMSNMALVTVGPAEPVVLQVLAKEGETLAGLAKKFNIDSGAMADQNPGIDPASPLTGEMPVEIPVPAGNTPLAKSMGISNPEAQQANPTQPVPTPPLPDPHPDTNPPSDAVVTLSEIDGCNIRISVKAGSGNADGYRVYMWRPASGIVPSMVQTHGPMAEGESFEFVEKNVYGFYRVVVEAYNGNGVSSSKQANIGVYSEACLKNAKKPADVKVLTKGPISKLYCYVTIDEKAFVHVPLSSDSYISSMKKTDLNAWAKKVMPDAQITASSGFDITSLLPVIYPKVSGVTHIKFECWDWEGTINLGTVEKDATKDELKTIIIMSGKNFDVVGIFGVSPYGDLNEVKIGTPVNFKSTGDPNLCAMHVPASSKTDCEQFIKIGMATVVWDYNQKKCFPGTEAWCHFTDIDGFHIYRHYKTGEPSQMAYGVGGKEKVTAGFAQWPPKPDCNYSDMLLEMTCLVSKIPCFTVRAYKGSIESHDSNEVCLTDQTKTTGTTTVTLNPSSITTSDFLWNDDPYNKDSTVASVPILGAYTNGILEIGHQDSIFLSIKEGSGSIWNLYLEETYTHQEVHHVFGHIFFSNFNEFNGKPINSAIFKFHIKGTYHFLDGSVNYTDNCARTLGVSKEPYILGGMIHKPPNYQHISKLPLSITPDEIAIDVTDVVKQWSQGQLNTGFVLDGSPDYGYVFIGENKCFTQYSDIKLDVTYFPNP